jgi:hypothetical protein
VRPGCSKQHAEYAHTILDEVLDHSPGVHWTDIAGLDVAKQILQVSSCSLHAMALKSGAVLMFCAMCK